MQGNANNALGVHHSAHPPDRSANVHSERGKRLSERIAQLGNKDRITFWECEFRDEDVGLLAALNCSQLHLWRPELACSDYNIKRRHTLKRIVDLPLLDSLSVDLAKDMKHPLIHPEDFGWMLKASELSEESILTSLRLYVEHKMIPKHFYSLTRAVGLSSKLTHLKLGAFGNEGLAAKIGLLGKYCSKYLVELELEHKSFEFDRMDSGLVSMIKIYIANSNENQLALQTLRMICVLKNITCKRVLSFLHRLPNLKKTVLRSRVTFWHESEESPFFEKTSLPMMLNAEQ